MEKREGEQIHLPAHLPWDPAPSPEAPPLAATQSTVIRSENWESKGTWRRRDEWRKRKRMMKKRTVFFSWRSFFILLPFMVCHRWNDTRRLEFESNVRQYKKKEGISKLWNLRPRKTDFWSFAFVIIVINIYLIWTGAAPAPHEDLPRQGRSSQEREERGQQCFSLLAASRNIKVADLWHLWFISFGGWETWENNYWPWINNVSCEDAEEKEQLEDEGIDGLIDGWNRFPGSFLFLRFSAVSHHSRLICRFLHRGAAVFYGKSTLIFVSMSEKLLL